MKKLTYKQVEKVFNDAGCELLSREYRNASTKLKYRCECGNISEILLHSFKQGHRCRKCGGTKLRERFKHPYRYVKQYFKEQGCELLEKEYQNSSTKMRYKCSCGELSKMCFNNFKQGNRCSKCGNKKIGEKQRTPYKKVYDYFKEQGCELLEKKYKNNRTKMKYKCSCGNISEIVFSSFKTGNRCNKCGSKKAGEKRKHLFEYVKRYFKEQGCELLEKEYKNANTKMKYKCSCGNISKIRFGGFKQGNRCNKCGGNEKYTYKYVKRYFEEQGCELLENVYTNNRTKMKYKCNCGNISKITFWSFKNGVRCIKCGGREKLTFKYVQQYFESNNCKLLEKEYLNAHIKMEYRCECGDVGKINFNKFQQGRRCQKCGVKKRSGKNNVNYNPNITDEERKIKRFYPEYRNWRAEIYLKDDYICQKCSQRGGVLNAHHILNYAENKNLRTDINNGVTLCKCCHKKFHKIYGIKSNNQTQLDSFLNEDLIYE